MALATVQEFRQMVPSAAAHMADDEIAELIYGFERFIRVISNGNRLRRREKAMARERARIRRQKGKQESAA